MESKRQAIIKTALTLMRSRGYENTKLSDILERADIGKGQFYYYFSSKHELGLAVIDYSFKVWNKNLLEDILNSAKDPETKFEEMLAWIIRRHSMDEAKCGCVFGNMAAEMSEHDEAFRAKVQSVFETWEDTLKKVLAEMAGISEANNKEELKNLATGIVAMLEGGILLMKSKQDISILTGMTDIVRNVTRDFVKAHAA